MFATKNSCIFIFFLEYYFIYFHADICATKNGHRSCHRETGVRADQLYAAGRPDPETFHSLNSLNTILGFLSLLLCPHIPQIFSFCNYRYLLNHCDPIKWPPFLSPWFRINNVLTHSNLLVNLLLKIISLFLRIRQ